MATISVQVPDELAEAINDLESPLSVSKYDLRGILFDEVRLTGEQIALIGEDRGPLEGPALRSLAQRLTAIACAAEIVA